MNNYIAHFDCVPQLQRFFDYDLQSRIYFRPPELECIGCRSHIERYISNMLVLCTLFLRSN